MKGHGGGQEPHGVVVPVTAHKLLRDFATNRKSAGSNPDDVIYFFSIYSFYLYYGHGIDSVSNRNEYQDSSWEIKHSRSARVTTSLTSVS
jgi:hypothetical protein